MNKKSSLFVLPVAVMKRRYEQGYTVPLAKRVPFANDPWQIFYCLPKNDYAFFLDSVKAKGRQPTFSFFGTDPFLVLRKNKNKVILETNKKERILKTSFISTARLLFGRYRGRMWPEMPFFTGGALGCFGYGLAWDFERLPREVPKDTDSDDALLLFVKNVFVFDHHAEVLYLISNLIPSKRLTFEDAFREAACDLMKLETHLFTTKTASAPLSGLTHFQADIEKHVFKNMVRRAQRYIQAGDIYQANLSQRFSFKFSGQSEMLYQLLRTINPSPFASFLKLKETDVISASPERLIKKTGNHCETRPIAGTRPRGEGMREHERMRRELQSNHKERAEHIMLVDLARNDLGRVCLPHSVRVNEMMVLEEYSHVIHLVSNVTGELAPGWDQFDLLKAMFPGGTITGCPKIRCMEVINELEPFARNFYTGSIGYLDFNGNMDLNIVIRTIVLEGERGYFQVGAGIVYDSDPESEFQETMHKGQALVEALRQMAHAEDPVLRY
ncbi:MAG: anthranilate synthase component I [Candidatus Omnitrophica bacterium CG11_big_fil_rev_8_21_14_0_20_45_26]|uniref:Anthranilate synthase component I n=1 Tax=Candidatus Abzuiibacterium crystallinum TaxID=1974748 RepID=A0A2H0LN63_9BACT|nr:MAG: anthranilate synthase component I [Candidatus Omnitrophica bacterium CG11_big_fil_rev_8_21_14_0_20_45_26]PIW65517.1 MAG: anthranilate synthase component I [Candidatus Omnitrophica bacterium CG12_big_fil_rev_8_21_14_0_65_45_16]